MNAATTDRRPIYSLETERSFLGAVLIDNSLMDKFSYLQPDHFYLIARLVQEAWEQRSKSADRQQESQRR